MTYPSEAGINPDLKAFLEEYLSLANKGSRLLSFDFFVKQPNPKKRPDDWHLALWVDQGERQALMDARGDTLCCYDEITPLFRLPRDPKTEATVTDIQDQIRCLRSKAPQDQIIALNQSLQTLCSPFRSLSPAYLVKEQGLYGIADPFGHLIVEVKYRRIAPFPFREFYGYPNDCGAPVHGGLYGQTGLYLCSGDLHELNSMDVYDLNGNLIFEGIARLYPREEALVTPERITEACSPLPATEKRVRSIWVSRQEARHPFPEAPQMQSIRDRSRRFRMRELSAPVDRSSEGLRRNPVDNTLLWTNDFGNARSDKYMKADPAAFRDLLTPMAAVISAHTQYPTEQILQRLGDYAEFYRERNAATLSLEGITLNSELTALGLTVRTYNCLIRNGIRTTGDILKLREEQIPRLKRVTPQGITQIALLRERLLRHFRE